MSIRYCMIKKDICSICTKVIKTEEDTDKKMYYCEKNSEKHEGISTCDSFICLNKLMGEVKCIKCHFCKQNQI